MNAALRGGVRAAGGSLSFTVLSHDAEDGLTHCFVHVEAA